MLIGKFQMYGAGTDVVRAHRCTALRNGALAMIDVDTIFMRRRHGVNHLSFSGP